MRTTDELLSFTSQSKVVLVTSYRLELPGAGRHSSEAGLHTSYSISPRLFFSLFTHILWRDEGCFSFLETSGHAFEPVVS